MILRNTGESYQHRQIIDNISIQTLWIKCFLTLKLIASIHFSTIWKTYRPNNGFASTNRELIIYSERPAYDRSSTTNCRCQCTRVSNSKPMNTINPVENVILIAMLNSLQKITEKCFKKCVPKPGTSLGASEQKCIAMCMDRFMDSWNLVSRTYVRRIQREQGGGGF